MALAGARPAACHRPTIVADSAAMRATLERVAEVARTRGGVLICGECGSGRHMLARELHHRDSSAIRPFVRLDCREVNARDLEIVLFGCAWAETGKPGGRQRFERTNGAGLLYEALGGTLFLANPTDLPAGAQVRLTRALRDARTIVPESRRLNRPAVRLMLSCDPTWDDAVREGRISSDLRRQVAAQRIDVPPLRDRRKDIPGLAALMLNDACAAAQVAVKTIEPPALGLLMALPWPGNVSQLRTLLQDLAVKVPHGSLGLDELLRSVHFEAMAQSPVVAGTLREARARFEHDYILSVLERHGGRIGDAAKALGIQRTNLYRKINALRVPRPRRHSAQHG